MNRYPELCECGRDYHVRLPGKARMGCIECVSLDGSSLKHFEVIQLLREQPRWTTRELSHELGITLNGAWMRLSRMKADGLVRAVSNSEDLDYDRAPGGAGETVWLLG